MGKPFRIDSPVPTPRPPNEPCQDNGRSVEPLFGKVLVRGPPSEFPVEEAREDPGAAIDPAAMPRIVVNTRHTVEDVAHLPGNERGKTILIGGDAKADHTVSARESLCNIEAEELGRRLVQVDGFWHRSRESSGNAELVLSQNILLMNLNREGPAIRTH